MYASSEGTFEKDHKSESSFGGEYVTKSEFDRVVKMFERKIAMLEAKINSSSGWDNK